MLLPEHQPCPQLLRRLVLQDDAPEYQALCQGWCVVLLTLLLQGCVLFKKRVGVVNDPLVDVLLQKGAIIVGKTNTPEFGAGSHTFNELSECNAVRQVHFVEPPLF